MDPLVKPRSAMVGIKWAMPRETASVAVLNVPVSGCGDGHDDDVEDDEDEEDRRDSARS